MYEGVKTCLVNLANVSVMILIYGYTFIVFQQTECLIRASMTLLKVPFIFPKHFFSSQQATFIKVCIQEFSMYLFW